MIFKQNEAQMPK